MRKFIGRGDTWPEEVSACTARSAPVAPDKSRPMKSARRHRLHGCRRIVLGNRRGHAADAKPEEN
jgi:hypothetical protein